MIFLKQKKILLKAISGKTLWLPIDLHSSLEYFGHLCTAEDKRLEAEIEDHPLCSYCVDILEESTSYLHYFLQVFYELLLPDLSTGWALNWQTQYQSKVVNIRRMQEIQLFCYDMVIV